MNSKVERIETNVVKLEISVEAEKFNEAMNKSYIKNSKKFNIPGFRKGKAPMNIIKKYYGDSVFYEDAINFCCDDTYPVVIKENNIDPVDYPQIDIVQIGEGKEFIYTAKVIVMPEVTLGEYKGVEVKEVKYPVTEKDIEDQLKLMLEKNARVEAKENGSIEMGNIAVIDFDGFVDGVAFEGGNGKDYSLEIGSGTFIGNFEEQLIGLSKGDSKDINVTFPENYGRDELNNKPATFKVTVNEIRVKELPELDDEFAKEISEFDTLEEVREDIKKKKQEENDLKEKAEFEENVIDTVCENASVEIPQIMVDKEIDIMLKDLEMRLKYQGLDLKSYYEYTNSTEEKVREYMKDAGKKRVKTELVLGEIAKIEKVEATDEELREKAVDMAKQYGTKDLEKTIDLILKAQKEYIKVDVVNEKTIKFLVENSKTVA